MVVHQGVLEGGNEDVPEVALVVGLGGELDFLALRHPLSDAVEHLLNVVRQAEAEAVIERLDNGGTALAARGESPSL